MLNRWIETEGLLDTLEDVGAGCIAFSPLAQGMLTGKYLDGDPRGLARQPGQVAVDRLLTDEALGAHPGAETSRSSAGSGWRSWRWPGRCGTGG